MCVLVGGLSVRVVVRANVCVQNGSNITHIQGKSAKEGNADRDRSFFSKTCEEIKDLPDYMI